ncbi:MAG: DUF262 domain-containing protein [Brevundimonas sp.]
MQRQPRPQDISWFLDLSRNNQLDLDPPYQRRSVWTTGDRRYFLDTIFNDYPVPAVFLHKSFDEAGNSIHHVVDGKQRLETILMFAADKLRIPTTINDPRLAGKKFSELDRDGKERFWNYSVSVEFLQVVDDTVVNNIFERINRNSRKLAAQELRHAKFEGWFISFVEAQSNDAAWDKLGVVTKARARRMADVQFLSELFLTTIKADIQGFSQSALDEAYAIYESPEEAPLSETTDVLEARFMEGREFLSHAWDADDRIRAPLRNQATFYSVWGHLQTHHDPARTPAEFARKLADFFVRMKTITEAPMTIPEKSHPDHGLMIAAFRFGVNLSGASTDETPRRERAEALAEGLQLIQ